MAFQQGLSGLASSSKQLDVISNNVANSSTVGFKSGQAHFSDVFAASLNGSGASQVGIGVAVSGVQQQFTQGNVTTTNNPLDIAINGGGFFRMDTNGSITFARNGQFHLDKNGFIVNDQSAKLTGYPVDATGVVVPSSPVDLQLSSANLAPVATGASVGGTFQGVQATLNLDSRQGVPTTAWVDGPPPGAAAAATAVVTNATIAGGAAAGAAATAAETAASTAALASVPPASAAAAAAAAAVAGFTAGAGGGAAAAAAAGAAAAAAVTAQEIAASTAALAAVPPASAAAAAAAAAAAGVNEMNNQFATAAGLTLPIAAVLGQTSAWSPNPTTYNYSTAVSVFDTLGNAHNLTMYFEKTAVTGEWNVRANVDGTSNARVTLTPSGGTLGGPLQFNTSGVLSAASAVVNVNIDLDGVMSDLGKPNNAKPTLAFNLDLTGSTQFGSAAGTNSLRQDGYTAGSLTGLSVGADGTVKGNYSNGQSRSLGQVVLADFSNPNGLQSLGNNEWRDTADSGPPLVGAPNSGRLGVLQSASVEESNVDLTSELVAMITAQRNYQANAQSIKTQDQIMQTLVNLR